MKKIFLDNLYAITDSLQSLGRPTTLVVKEMLEAGVKIVQYREKNKKMGEMLRECLEIRKMTKEHDALFIINDHADLALLCQADGAHVGQDDLPVEATRSLLGPEAVIGLSTHCPEQAAAAVRQGVDYIGVGPIFDTATKKDICPAVGLEYLEYVVSAFPQLPHVAIGGIKRHNLPLLLRRGARCCALVSEITAAPDIGLRIHEIKKIIERESR